MASLENLSGKKFGRLVVVDRRESSQSGAARWLCICDCGNTSVVFSRALKTGNTTSCGCWRKEQTKTRSTTHGATNNKCRPLYDAWKSMRSRCRNPKDKSWPDYGGRGISICQEWSDFAKFCADMGDRPFGLSLERINNDGPYCAENCVWADRATQNLNQRRTRFITVCGERMPLITACRKFGIDPDNVRNALYKSNVTPIEAFLSRLSDALATRSVNAGTVA